MDLGCPLSEKKIIMTKGRRKSSTNTIAKSQLLPSRRILKVKASISPLFYAIFEIAERNARDRVDTRAAVLHTLRRVYMQMHEDDREER